MASLKEIFEKAQKTGKVEYTFFGGGNNITPFNQTSIPFTEGNNKTLSSNPPYIRLGYEGSFPGDLQFRTDDPTNTYNTLLASTRDTARIGAFFTDFPNGPLWLAKQSVLQLTNPDTSYKTAEGRTTLGDKLSQITGPRFYNPIGTNTLAQVASNALGLHFTRHGLSPVLGGSEDTTGYINLNKIETTGKIQSRLTLYKNKLENFKGKGSVLLSKYQAGPDSTYRIGGTQTDTYKDSFGLNTGETDKQRYFSDDELKNYPGFNPWSYKQIQDYSKNLENGTLTAYPGEGTENKFIQDFRQEANFEKSENYPKLNIHSRTGVTTGQRQNIFRGDANTVDSINVLTITPSTIFYNKSKGAKNSTNGQDKSYFYSGLYDQNETKSKTNGYYGRDIIKFRIELLNNDKPTIGDGTQKIINTDVLTFRAYLADMSDDVTPTWKSFNYMGRGEDFYVYEKFSRSMNFSFFLYAHSEYEMPAIYTKLNYLMSSMAPDYNDKNQMRGTYAYLTIGDYVYRQPGVFTKMSISDLLTAPWEIALNEPENRLSEGRSGIDAKQHEVPKYMKVTMGFNPIHNFLPRKNRRTEPHTATFITPNWKISHPNRYLPQGPEAPVQPAPGLITTPPL